MKAIRISCPRLLRQTAQRFTVKEVSADKAYSGRDNHEAIDKVGATAYIAFKANATGKVGGVYEKMYHFFCSEPRFVSSLLPQAY